MVFHWSLSNSKSPQVSRTRLSILAALSNAVVWIVSTRPLTSKSSRPFNNPLVTVPNAPITIDTILLLLLLLDFSHQREPIVFHWSFLKSPQVSRTLVTVPNGIIITFMFHSFFSSLARSRYLSFFSHSFSFILWSAGIIIIICSLEFSHQRKLMVFHWRLSDSKSPQVSRTLLSILAVFNNAVVWMFSTRSPTSKSSRPFNNPLVTVPKVTNHNWYNCHLHVP